MIIFVFGIKGYVLIELLNFLLRSFPCVNLIYIFAFISVAKVKLFIELIFFLKILNVVSDTKLVA